MDELEADVVIVGGGGAGLAAAVEASDLGGKVVVLEKRPVLGGTTELSIGSFTANRTGLQKRAGIQDTADAHFEDMGKFAGDRVSQDNLTLRRLYVERCGETLEWLRSLGLVFFGPAEEPPHRCPRMHNVLPNARAYAYQLSRAAKRRGTRILVNGTAQELTTSGGAVTGVIFRGADGRRTKIRARRGVILAAGDFSSSEELKRRYINELSAHVPGINPSSTGDGIRLGLEAGGHVVNGGFALGPELRFNARTRKLIIQRIPPYRAVALFMSGLVRWVPERLMRPFIMAFATTYLAPSRRLFELGAMMVNRAGDRFTDEIAEPWRELLDQPGAEAFIIFDNVLARQLKSKAAYVSTAPGIAYAFLQDYRRNRKDLFHRGKTVGALAKSIGLEGEKLERAMRSREVDGGASRSPEPPYYALGPVRPWIVLTEGGLAVDEGLRVLREDGSPITGLFAAGSNGQGGLLLEGHGNHVGWAVTSGRLAARNAMTGSTDAPA